MRTAEQRKLRGGSFLIQNDSLKPPRSEEGSLRDEIPQAGLGGSPTYPLFIEKNVVSEQTAKQSAIETGLPENACFQR